MHIKKVVFKNDTHATAEDGQSYSDKVLPVGFVCGTGHNAVIESDNLEIAKRPCPADPLISDEPSIEEYYMGGDYIKKRYISSLAMLRKQGFQMRPLEYDEGQFGKSTLSQIASGRTEDGAICTLLAKRILHQAGEYLGVNIAAVIGNANYDGESEAYIPVEGSVILKGFGIKKTINQILHTIYPKNKLKLLPSIGMRGVGKVALVHVSK